MKMERNQNFVTFVSSWCKWFELFIYDDLDRLTSADYFASYPTGDETFDYDKIGNRLEVQQGATTQEYTVDNLTNQYTAIDAQSISHDDAGNLTQDHRGYLYTYDFENRLIAVAEPNQTLVAEFAYDALGRRIRKVDHAASETTLYYYNQNWQTLCETNENDVVQRCYIYGNFIDEPLIMVDADDHYYVHNHLYSAAALLDEDGSVLERYEYDAYGRPYLYDASFNLLATQESAHNNSLLFTSRPTDLLDDGELPLQDNRHRTLDFATGRWLQRDPLGVVPNGYLGNESFSPIAQYTEGVNAYAYVKSMPIQAVDSMGLNIPGVDYMDPDPDKYKGHCDFYLLWDTSYGQGHAWIESGSDSWGFRGSGGAESPDTDAGKRAKVRVWPLKKKTHGYLRFGFREGKKVPCKCATCREIKRCVGAFRVWTNYGDKTTGKYNRNYGFTYNCRHWSGEAIDSCCLKKGYPYDYQGKENDPLGLP